MIKKHRLSQISKETLDYVFVKLPKKNEWKKYYVRYHNSQLLFCQSVKRHDFKCSYSMYKAMVRKTKTYIGGVDEGKPRKIDVIMISHKYDDDCLYLTIPEIFESPDLHYNFLFMLDEILKLLTANAMIVPEGMIGID